MISTIIISVALAGLTGAAGYMLRGFKDKYLRNQIDLMKRNLKEQKELTEKYRAIAKTHEVIFPEHKNLVKDLGTFDYRSSIEENIKFIKNDLKKLDAETLNITLSVNVVGDWKQQMKSCNWSFTNSLVHEWSICHSMKNHFYGDVDKIVRELELFLKTECFGLWNKNQLQWYCPDSFINFKIEVKGRVKPQNTDDLKIVYVDVLVEEPKPSEDPLYREAEAEIEKLMRIYRTKETQ